MAADSFPSVRTMPERFDSWLRNHSTPELIEQAQMLPLRRDLLALLEFVGEAKIVGTQSTGNMPLKAVRAVTERFVDPPPLKDTIGDQVYHLRSEEHLWPLYFLRIMAQVGGLLKIDRSRRWHLTGAGKAFFTLDPMLQVCFLLLTWWYRINWVVAYPVAGLEAGLPRGFQVMTLAHIRCLPVDQEVPIDWFSDQLVTQSGLRWGAGDIERSEAMLRIGVERMVIRVLRDFEVLECRTKDEVIGDKVYSELISMGVTTWGQSLLNALATIPRS